MDSSLVHVVDLFSTMLDLAGVPLPSTVTLDSKSLGRILANQGDSTRTRLYVEQFNQAASTAGGRTIRDDRYKLIRFNTGIDQFYDILTDVSETNNLLVNGIDAMSLTHRAYYYRLRFNLGNYTITTVVSPLGHSVGPAGFSLVVPDQPTATQTMWQSNDLDFWSPSPAVTQVTSGSNITFTASPPLRDKCFYSILAENP